MADIWIKVLVPADSYALLTLEELKVILNLPPTDTSEDVQLNIWIEQYSDVIATMCNRVFGYETVEETWRGDLPPFDAPRLFLTHYPVADADITSVELPRGSVLDPANYELESVSGKLRINGAWAEPVTVTYSGGYHLPDGGTAGAQSRRRFADPGGAAAGAHERHRRHPLDRAPRIARAVFRSAAGARRQVELGRAAAGGDRNRKRAALQIHAPLCLT